MRKSRIRPIRRALLKLAMWRDPEARWPDDYDDFERMFDNARNGIIEDKVRLRRGFYAFRYLVGDRP